MSGTAFFSFSVLSAITFAFAYGPILQKLSLGLVSPYPKADITKRMFAATVDVLLVAAMLFYYRAFASFGCLILAITYVLFRDTVGGRSFGKFLFGLVVADLKTGRPCGYGAAIRRNALFLVPGVNLVATFLESSTIVRDPQGQRLGDRFALTQVVEGFGLKDLLTGVQQWLADLADQLAEQFGGRVRKPDRAPAKVPYRIEIRIQARPSKTVPEPPVGDEERENAYETVDNNRFALKGGGLKRNGGNAPTGVPVVETVQRRPPDQPQ